MKVFISWSGEKSRDVAVSLRTWLPRVIQAVDPFMSASRDLAAGSRWALELAGNLADTDFGLVCVTRENQLAPWLNFEAGAIAKSLDEGRVVPLAIDLNPADIEHPLGQFQAARATKEGLREVLVSLNEVCPVSLAEPDFAETFEKWWPDLADQLDEIASRSYADTDQEYEPRTRSEREMIEELVDSMRGLSRLPSSGPHRPDEDEILREDLRRVIGDSKYNHWTTIFHSPGELEIQLPGPPSRRTLNELEVVERLRGVSIRVSRLPEEDDFEHG